MATVSASRVPVGPHEFHVNEAGDPGRPTVLLLHGAGPGATAASNWQAVMEDLGEDYHCLAPDVLGFGESSHPAPLPTGLGPYTELRVEALLGLLQARGVERATVVGNSMGGMWTLGMARREPERVEKMILMGAGGAPVAPGPSLPPLVAFYDNPTREAMAELLRDFVASSDLFADQLDEIVSERMLVALRPEIEASHRATFDFSKAWTLSDAELAAMHQPTLIVHGREDTVVTFEAAMHFFGHLRNARLYGIANCGHWAQIEHRDQFVAAVRGFLKGRL